MCGIAGYVSKADVISTNIIKNMTDVIVHRGPDGEGHFLYKNIALGHRRLSIVDLTVAGHQPMHYKKRYVITYNGEIYNYIELRKNLKEHGYNFTSQTDTEVILAAYDFWGIDCLNKFNGMWAFTIYDKISDEFFISRDRFGIKPLYFYQDDENLVFASEIKAILQHPSVQARPNIEYFSKYLKNGPAEYISETAFENIFRFPFASFTKFKRDKAFQKLSTDSFWTVKPNLSVEKFNKIKAKQYAEQYYDLLSDSVGLRLRADVKIGSALSGGLDSSSIVYLVNQHLKKLGKEELQETFSTVYKSDGTQHCDESVFIDLLAKKLNVNSNQIEPKEKDVPKELEKVIWFMENPPESTCMSGWHTFKKVKEKKVVVSLDGQGADEQLAGYTSYIHVYLTSLTLFDFYKQVPFFFKIPKSAKHVFVAFLMNHFKFFFGEKLLKSIVKKIKGIDLELNLNQSLMTSTNTSLITLIHYADRASMGHSIESRMPFMDYRLVEFLATVPATYKVHNGWSKYLARLAFNDKLPDEICWRKDKMGWPIPESYWLRGGLREWVIKETSRSTLLSKLTKNNNINRELNSKVKISSLTRKLNISKFENIFFKNE